MDVFLYVVLACGDKGLGLGRFSVPKAASRTRCFVIMNNARLQILTKKKEKDGGQCFSASAIIPSNRGMPDDRYKVFWAVTQTPSID